MVLWAVFAVVIFWGVGVHNRLMRMRAKGLEALDTVCRYLQRYDALVHAHLGSEVENIAIEWHEMQAALVSLNSARGAIKLSPLDVEAVQTLARSYQALQDSWIRLNDIPNDLAGQRLPEGLQVEWERISQKTMHARNKYHQIATDYNRALTQFPASLLVRVAGFKAAGTL